MLQAVILPTYTPHGEVVKQIGGWGYMLDDAGSGYNIGRNGLRAVLRALDGRGATTKLTELYEKQLGKSVYSTIPDIYEKGKQYIASFCPLVFEAEAEGDFIAREILEAGAKELSLVNYFQLTPIYIPP